MRILVGLVMVVCLLSCACAPRETPVETGRREGVLHRSIGAEPASLDPHLATSLAEIHAVSELFEGLVAPDPKTTAPAPAVAERWEVSPDGLVYTFYLRPEARWSDGRPVTAGDFVTSVRRALALGLGAPNAALLYPVRNAEALRRGGLGVVNELGIFALDTHVLRIELERPTAHFLSLLSHPVWFPVPQWAVEAAGPADARGNRWASSPATFVGNGPFVLREWWMGRRMVLAASPTWRGAAEVRLREVHLHFFEGAEAEERSYRAGQLHVTEALPAARLAAWREQAPEQLRMEPVLETYFFRFNTARPPLHDVRVRRALNLAIDREALVAVLLPGGRRPARAFVPPRAGGYDPPELLRYDLERARALLAEAGYPGGIGLPVLELLYNTSDNHRRIAEVLQAQWREAGVQTRLVNQEFATLLEARRTGDFQILRGSWVADFDDPVGFLELFVKDSDQNFTGWSDPSYDRALGEAARTVDPVRRQALLREAETILLEAAPILPLFVNSHIYLLHPAVRGWRANPLARYPLRYVYFE